MSDKFSENISQLKDRMVPEVPKERYDLLVLQSLRRIIRAVDLHSKHLSSTYEITSPQLLCLLAVAENKQSTITEIAQTVYLSPSTVVGILDRLEKRNLIERKRDIHDRRVVNVSITRSGKKLAKHAPSPLQENLAEALAKLPELEQTTIALSLQRIVDLMEVKDLEAAPILEMTHVALNNPDNDPSPT